MINIKLDKQKRNVCSPTYTELPFKCNRKNLTLELEHKFGFNRVQVFNTTNAILIALVHPVSGDLFVFDTQYSYISTLSQESLDYIVGEIRKHL